MQRLRKTMTACGAVCMLALAGAPLHAQEVAAAACDEGEIAKGSLGYSGLECNCDFTYLRQDEGEGQFSYTFRAEPVILGVKSGGPADGKLRAGDVITSIDGYLITTREGGKRFANPEVGRPVTLGVRRNGRSLEVQVVPEWECQRVDFGRGVARAPRPDPPPRPSVRPREPAPVARPVEPTPPERVAIEMPVVVEVAPEPMEVAVAIAPRALMVLPRGYFGFGISCRDCSVEIDDDSVPVWEFTHNPELTGVEPGMPAHDAGMRSGDILTHIDGSEMTSAEGGRLFGAVQPGDTVTFRFARNNTSREVQVVAEERTWARARVRAPAAVPVEPAVPLDPAMPAPPAQPTGIPSITRFTGVLGDTQVVVTGGPITVSRTDDQVIIVSGDVRVTLTRK